MIVDCIKGSNDSGMSSSLKWQKPSFQGSASCIRPQNGSVC
jgi:hypothetical protein